MKSIGNFKRNFWYDQVKQRLESVSNDLKKGERGIDFNRNLKVVSNEVRKELLLSPKIEFEFVNDLTPDRITSDIVNAAINYIDKIKRYYIEYYNFADGKKDSLIQSISKEDFNALREKHHNKSLEEFVVNKNETTTIIEYKGELIQKMDPVFMDPEYKFIKAHFYSPTKQIFGIKIDTFNVNILVLWIMIFVLYLALYLRVLKKLLDSGEVVMGRKPKGAE
jgi:hypothetical protein